LTLTETDPAELAPSHSALLGVRVVDLTSTVAGQFCGRLFADNGADVVLVESSPGTTTRRATPLVTARTGETASALFWHVNLGKRSVRTQANQLTDAVLNEAAIRKLIDHADVVLLDRDVDLETLPASRGPQVVIVISPFGSGNDYAAWRGGELVFQAFSGTMYENGLPDREPLYGVGHRASYAAGTFAYTEGVALLLVRPAGRHVVDVGVAEVAANMNFSRVAQYSYNGHVLGRDAKETQRAIVRVSDGWLGLFVNEERWVRTCRALGVDDLILDARFADPASRRENWPDIIPELEIRLAGRRVDDLVASGQAAKAVVARSMPLLELARAPQLTDRGFWDDINFADLPNLGPMFNFELTPQLRHRTAPVLGTTDAGAVSDAWARQATDSTPVDSDRAILTPLAGVRVLDLTSAWAGPMSTRLLASLGADVIKVEGPGRIDDWRGAVGGGHPDRYPDGIPGERPYDRNFQFNTQNHDKRGIILDLKEPRGQQIMRELVEKADVLVANFSTGTLERMGIGWETLKELNPNLVLLEMPAYGSTGPMATYVAYGPSMELMSGTAGIIGYGDGRPTTTGPAYNDPIGGLHGAAAVVTALAARQQIGRGQRVEIAQRDAAMHWIGEEIIAAIMTGREPIPHANRRDDSIPHGAFRTAGDDEWVAITAGNDDEFRRLWALLRCETDIPVSTLSSLEGRSAHRELIDAALSNWARPLDKFEAARILQRAGVTAAAVLNARDLANSDYLGARGLLQVVHHREAGTHLYPALPVHIDGQTHVIGQAAPCFGEHNAEVLGELLGLDNATLGQLFRDGVIADVPRG